jgi:hypothetical protein
VERTTPPIGPSRADGSQRQIDGFKKMNLPEGRFISDDNAADHTLELTAV